MMRYCDVARLRLLLAASVLSLSLHGAAALAQDTPAANGSSEDADDDAGDPGDILVTATRQTESISRVPISISAYDQEQLDQLNVRRMDDIARLTPGVTLARRGNGNQANLSIRGISSVIATSTTGVYIDDTPVQMRTVGVTAVNPFPLIFDLERVEVLRGPQGTLFGSSAMGGAIRFITPQPDLDEVSAYGRAELSTIDSGGTNYEAGAAIGAPIVEGALAFRASAWYRHDGGYIDRVGPLTASGFDADDRDKNINQQNSYATKFDLTWQATPDFSITPSVYYQWQKSDAPTIIYAKTSDVDNLDYTTPNQLDTPTKDRFVLPALKMQLDLGGVQAFSNTSYFDRRLDQTFDYTYQSAETNSSLKPYITIDGQYQSSVHVDQQKVFTQEFRLQSEPGGMFNWVVGAFYSHAKQFAQQDIIDPYYETLLLARTGKTIEQTFGHPMLDGDIFFETKINSVDEEIAGFAQLDFSPIDKLKLTAGARVSHSTYDAEILRDGPLAGGYSLTEVHQKENPITPKFGISYQADPSLLIYASAAKGFRSGGAQAKVSSIACAASLAALGLTESPSTFASDSLWSYEVGVKKRAGSVFSVESSAYLIKWDNYLDKVTLAVCGGSYIANVGKVTSKGFDVAVTARPLDGLMLSAAVGYTRAAFDDTIYRGETAILRTKGSRLAVPPVTLRLSGAYEFPVSSSTDAYVRADYQYSAEAPLPKSTDYGVDPLAEPLAEVNNLDLRVGARFSEVDLSLFVANALNDQAIQYFRSSTAASLWQALAPRPRTIGLTATYRY